MEWYVSFFDVFIFYEKNLSFQNKESENSMTSNEENKSKNNIENGIFCLFELFFISSRDQYKPSCIDNKEHADHREKSIKECEELSNNSNTRCEINLLDITSSNIDNRSWGILTSWSTIEWTNNSIWDLNEEKTDDRIENGIFWFFCLFFISSGRNEHKKCPNCHKKKSKSCKHLEKVHNWGKYINPKFPTKTTSYYCRISSEIESVPYWECNLHNKNTNWGPDNIWFPFFYIFFITWWEEELDDTNNQENNCNRYEKILDLECNRCKCINNSIWSSGTR